VDLTKFAHKFDVGSSLKTYFRKKFSPLLKIWQGLTSKLPTPPSFVAPAFRKGLNDHNSDFKIDGNRFCICVQIRWHSV